MILVLSSQWPGRDTEKRKNSLTNLRLGIEHTITGSKEDQTDRETQSLGKLLTEIAISHEISRAGSRMSLSEIQKQGRTWLMALEEHSLFHDAHHYYLGY